MILKNKSGPLILFVRYLVLTLICCGVFKCRSGADEAEKSGEFQSGMEIGAVKSMENGTRWTRCFRGPDGIIYFKDSLMSSDGGKTWTAPEYKGLDRGCDPCLVALRDGRIALSWGRRFPEGWSRLTREGDKGWFKYPGEGYISLSISNDGGSSWSSKKIISKSGSCYSTIIETEPGGIFLQSGSGIAG